MEFGENGFKGTVHNPPDGEPHPFELCEQHGHMDPRRPDAPAGPLHEALYSKSDDGQVTMLLQLPDTALERLLGLKRLLDVVGNLPSQKQREPVELLPLPPVEATVGSVRVALTPKQRRAFLAELDSTEAAGLPELLERWRELAQAAQDRRANQSAPPRA